MTLGTILREVCLLLVVLVPCLILSNRLRFGGILGLLVGGFLLGPGGAGIIEATGSLHTISELGIVLFLFVIGLELQPGRMGRSWRHLVMLGILQVILTGAVLTLLMVTYTEYWIGAVIAGFTLAMSSTALAMQTLRERGELGSDLGHKALAILVVQDLAVVPLLAIVPMVNPLLITPESATLEARDIALPIGAIVIVAVVARFLVPTLIAHLARRQDTVSIGATVALLVLGSAVIVDAAGLPMTLGAFVAGLALAASSERERIARVVMPHQSLLLALFFVTVGMSIRTDDLDPAWGAILVIAPATLFLKALVIYGVARSMRSTHEVAWRLALLLSQVGEFGFVVAAATLSIGWATPARADAAIVVIAITMVATPIVQRFVPRLREKSNPAESPSSSAHQ